MIQDVVAPAGAPAPRRKGSVGRMAVRGAGELMITFGLILLLLVVYQLFYTNLEANRAQNGLKNDLRSEWMQPVSKGNPIKGDAIGIVYIERLGKNWEKPLVEGVDLDSLSKGVGHFPASVLPGKVGNFSIAAHRATHGEPFANLDRIQPKDTVVVETRNRWFVYTIIKMPGAPAEHPAWKLVDPSNGSVVLPVPEMPEATPTEKRITLVTCNPRWGSSTRLIVYGKLTATYQKPGALPPELAYTAGKA
ncbi:MAG: class E sortase [Sporichthyaceae bacterium]